MVHCVCVPYLQNWQFKISHGKKMKKTRCYYAVIGTNSDSGHWSIL